MALGSYLKEARIKNNLSLKEVKNLCGVTDSKLSRVERGQKEQLYPDDLKKLAELYKLNTVELFIAAGCISKSDLADYQLVFNNADLLTEEEKQSIQTQVDLFVRGRRQ